MTGENKVVSSGHSRAGALDETMAAMTDCMKVASTAEKRVVVMVGRKAEKKAF